MIKISKTAEPVMSTARRAAPRRAPVALRSQLRNSPAGAVRPVAGPAVRRVMPAAATVMLVAGVAACSSSHPAASSSPAGQSTAGTPGGTATPAASGGTATPAASGAAGSSTHAAPKKDIIAGLIAFNGKLSFSGAHSTKMSFSAFPGVTSPKSSCADLAAGGTPVAKGRVRQFQIPSPPEGGDVVIAAEISPYHGPGTYQKASVVAVGPSVVVGNASYNLLAAGATVTVTFRANGSGQLTFTGATAAQSGQPALAGAIQWSCVVQ